MAAALFTVFYVAGASATLGGSPYDGTDGTPDNVTGITAAPDDPSGSNDNSFGQGTKEDNSAVTVVSGSIPPNKNDLTNFYEGSTQTSSGVFLYLGWTRAVNIGNANLDFEINKNHTPSGCDPTVLHSCWDGSKTGSFTINRTNGDILVTYDFGGSGAPTLGVNRWLVSGAQNPDQTNHPGVNTVSECLSANALPCWGDHVTLGDLNAEGSVSSDGLFGEAVINLTGAGILSMSSCDFGQATTFLKSRSSSSFTAELKDFIAPVSTPITNCATLRVVKHTFNQAGTRTGFTQSFTFTPSSNLSGSNFSLTDSGTDGTSNTQVFSGLGAGTYTVSESDPGPNFALTGVSCVNTGTTTSHGTTSTSSTPNASVTLAAGNDVTCTFNNTQQLGAIRVHKVSSKDDSSGNPIPLSGAQFTYALKATDGTVGSATNFPSTTNSSGFACVGGLALGKTYRIAESSAPSGFSKDSSTQDVTVNSAGTCTSGYTNASSDFVDTPLTDLSVQVASEASTGGTQSNISCVDSGGNAVGNSPQPANDSGGNTQYSASATLNADSSHGAALTPGTYTCTVVIDP